MLPPTYAIVDVETTGQSAVYGRIIEIAVIRVEEGKIVRRFESLVNPGRYINPFIQGITGITNDDVAGAPTFSRIAKKVHALLDGAVFVAHNARFDYSFVKNELAAAGFPFSARCLCTVKLSRVLFPQHRRHDLSSIIERHRIDCEARHRAMGDAEAVHGFLALIEKGEDSSAVETAVRKILKTSSFPSHLDPASFEALPETPGVYLFYGKDGELLYVGKSVNLRDRVRSHFSGDTTSAKEGEMCRQIHRVEYRKTAGELGALLLESQMIKELRPMYNAVARQKRNLIVARRKRTRDGYLAVALEEIEQIQPQEATTILGVFKHTRQGADFLAKIAREHQLCHKLLGLERTRSYCFSYHLKQCHGACMGEEPVDLYNRRVEDAFERRRVKAWPFPGGIAIEERGESSGSGEVFVVDNWCLVSTIRYGDGGFLDQTPPLHRFDYDSYKILARYLQGRSSRTIVRHVPPEELETILSCREA